MDSSRLHRRRQLGDEPLYCQTDPSEVLYEGSDDELYESSAQRRLRYEAAAVRFLEGRPRSLLSASLRGPFDAASGWTNPWRSKTVREPSKESLQGRHPPTLPDNIHHVPAVRKPASHISTACHLPSPQSLDSTTAQHQYLGEDELARVENWRTLVEPEKPMKPSPEQFRAPSSDPASKRKRSAQTSSWLKRGEIKRRRVTANAAIPALPSPMTAHHVQDGSPTPRSSVPSQPLKAEVAAAAEEDELQVEASQSFRSPKSHQSAPRKSPTRHGLLRSPSGVLPSQDSDDELSKPSDSAGKPRTWRAASARSQISTQAQPFGFRASPSRRFRRPVTATPATRKSIDPVENDPEPKLEPQQEDSIFQARRSSEARVHDSGSPMAPRSSSPLSSVPDDISDFTSLGSRPEEESPAAAVFEDPSATNLTATDVVEENNTYHTEEAGEDRSGSHVGSPLPVVPNAPIEGDEATSPSASDHSVVRSSQPDIDLIKPSQDGDVVDMPETPNAIRSVSSVNRGHVHTVTEEPMSLAQDHLDEDVEMADVTETPVVGCGEDAIKLAVEAEIVAQPEEILEENGTDLSNSSSLTTVSVSDNDGASSERQFDDEAGPANSLVDTKATVPCLSSPTHSEFEGRHPEAQDNTMTFASLPEQKGDASPGKASITTTDLTLEVERQIYCESTQYGDDQTAISHTEGKENATVEESCSPIPRQDPTEMPEPIALPNDLPSEEEHDNIHRNEGPKSLEVEQGGHMADSQQTPRVPEVSANEAQLDNDPAATPLEPNSSQSTSSLAFSYTSQQSPRVPEAAIPTVEHTPATHHADDMVVPAVVSPEQQSPWSRNLSQMRLAAHQALYAAGFNMSFSDRPDVDNVPVDDVPEEMPEELRSSASKDTPSLHTAPSTPEHQSPDAIFQDASSPREALCAATPTPAPKRDGDVSDFELRPFSTFRSPSPEPCRNSKVSSGRLPGIRGILAATTRNPRDTTARPKSNKRVSWASLPQELSDGIDGESGCDGMPGQTRERAASPPPDLAPSDLPTGSEDQFKHHFSAVKEKAKGHHHGIIASASEQGYESSAPITMPDASAAANNSHQERDDTKGNQQLPSIEDKDQSEDVVMSHTHPEVDDTDAVDDVLNHLDDFIDCVGVETDTQQAEEAPHDAGRFSMTANFRVSIWD